MIRTIIVEDEFLVRVGLRTVIDWEKEGYTIVGEAPDGLEGVRLYNELKPDLVITDIKMPKLSGLDMMKEIREHDLKVQFIVISAYDDFQFAKQAIEIGVKYYCLKGSMMDSELIDILKGVRESFDKPIKKESVSETKNIQLVDLVGDSKEKIETVQLIKEYFTDFSNIYIIYMKNNMPLVKDLIENELNKNHIVFMKVFEDNAIYYVVQLSIKQDILKYTLEMQQIVKRYSEKKLVIGVSKRIEDFDRIKVNFRQAFLAYQNSFFLDEETVIVYTDKEKMDNVQDVYKKIDKFNHSLMRMDEQSAKNYLTGIKESVIKRKSVRLLQKVLYKLIDIVAEYDDQMIEGEFYKRLLNKNTIEEMFDELWDLIDQLSKKEVEVIERQSQYLNIVKSYIEENYHTNLKIKHIADYIHLSPSYLGKLFYLETKIYLTDYITQVRLEKACELLRNQDLTISEVASRVGIEDQHYFSKVFKKHYGASPKEYGIRSRRLNHHI